MLKFYIFILCLFLIKTCAAQLPVLQWAKTFTADNSYNYGDLTNGRTVGTDQQGNVYSAGLLQHTVDFDPGTGAYPLSAGQMDNGIYISKLSPTGGFIWARQISTLIEFGFVEMKVDKSGNVYLTAYFSAPTDMDPGPGVLILTPIGGKDAFVIKLDTNGNLVWVKQFGGVGDTVPYGSALDIDQDGNVIVCGSFNRTVDFDPGPNTFNLTSTGNFEAFITKLNSNGDFIWAKKLGNYSSIYPSISINDVRCDPSGNIYSTGDFSGDCDFDPGPANYNLIAGGPGDGFISKLDKNGNFVWAKKIGNSENNEIVQPHGIDLDGENNVYTTGLYLGIQDFDPGNGVYNLAPNQGGFNGYVLKLDAQGNFIWANGLNGGGSGEGLDLVIDKADNVYVDGDFNGTIDFDPGPGSFLINDLYDETVLAKFNPDGGFVYACAFRGGSSYGRRLSIDDSINIYMTGYIAGTIDFDPGPNVYPVSSTSDYSPFVLKLSRCTNITTASLNITACDSITLNNKTFDSSGTYTQVIPNTSGCDSIITLHLTINKKFTEQTKVICEGEVFFAGGANQHTSGTYKDTLQASSGCDSVVTTYLTVNPKPLPNLGADKDLCQGSQLSVTPGSFTKYLWQDMSTQNSFNITAAGLFWVTVTNSFNCSATDSITINTVIPGPGNFLKATDSICNNDKLSLQVQGSFNSYFWSTGESQNKIVVEAPGRYWLKVTDANGCNGTDTVTVFPKECIHGVYIPTAFTPNGDGRNDYFKALVYGNIVSFKLQVFDKFGQVVFQTTDPNKKWDGFNKGVPYPTTVFVWQCMYQLENKQPVYKKGVVTLIH